MRRGGCKSEKNYESLVGWMRKLRYRSSRRGELRGIGPFWTEGQDVRTR